MPLENSCVSRGGKEKLMGISFAPCSAHVHRGLWAVVLLFWGPSRPCRTLPVL